MPRYDSNKRKLIASKIRAGVTDKDIIAEEGCCKRTVAYYRRNIRVFDHFVAPLTYIPYTRPKVTLAMK